jgi:hypothetical protein
MQLRTAGAAGLELSGWPGRAGVCLGLQRLLPRCIRRMLSAGTIALVVPVCARDCDSGCSGPRWHLRTPGQLGGAL